jgi:GH25 family lysozyme M1 (1,4-beta-N-acetylmuramidase)
VKNKKLMRLPFFLCILSLKLSAQISEFNKPWEDSTKAIIIDAYSENKIDWVALKTDKRVVAVIHKASQGEKADPGYSTRKAITKQQGLLFGSYHLATPGDPIRQADCYLEMTGGDTTELLALDLESLDSTKHMTLANAEKFIRRVFEATGRYPIVYCNRVLLNEISSRYNSNSLFAKCGLWYARMRSDIPDYNATLWPGYTLWQFSCEINCKTTGTCLYNVPGTAYDMDVNVYNGSVEELRRVWPSLK